MKKRVAIVVLAIAAIAELSALAWRLQRPAPDPLAGERALEGPPPEVHELDGQTIFELRSPRPDTDALRLELTAPNAGARVDVYGMSAQGRVPLMRDQRISGKRIEVRFPAGDYPWIDVTVHHHLRAPPAVARQDWYVRGP